MDLKYEDSFNDVSSQPIDNDEANHTDLSRLITRRPNRGRTSSLPCICTTANMQSLWFQISIEDILWDQLTR